MKKNKKHVVVIVVVIIILVVVAILVFKPFKKKKEDGTTTVEKGAGKTTIEGKEGQKSEYDQNFPLKKGSKGKYVSAIQRTLNKKKNAGLTVDGIWGDKTDVAIKKAGYPAIIYVKDFQSIIK